jgi:hypothetical protein
MMVRVIATAIFLWGVSLSSVAHAEDCFVLYKAKKDNPLKLHLGLMKIDRTCSDDAIERFATKIQSADGHFTSGDVSKT